MAGNGDANGFFTEVNDPDDLPIKMADGVITFRGGAWCGSWEWFSIVEFKVSSPDGVAEGMMELQQAHALRDALDAAIAAAEQSAADHN